MAVPVTFFGQTIADNTVKGNGQPETASWQVAVNQLTLLDFDAVSNALTDLATAVNAFTIGQVQSQTTVGYRVQVSPLPAASNLAQRENKLLLRYHGATTNKKFQVSIPTFDLTKLIAHSEFIDLSAGIGATLKTKFEAIVRSPDDGAELVVLDSGQFVGRNS